MSREKCRLKYGDGDIYVGHVDDDGLRHGDGSYLFETQGRYEGEWRLDRMHGPGSFFFEDGGIYAGMWLQDQKHGRGCSIHWHPQEGLFVYDGDFRLDQREGVAVYKVHTPSSVETNIGLFKDNVLHQGLRVVTPHAAPAQVFSIMDGTEKLCAGTDVDLRLLPERRRQILLQAFRDALRPMSPLTHEDQVDAIDMASFPLSTVLVSKSFEEVANPGEFLREIALLSKIRHPSVVTVFGCTEDMRIVSAVHPPAITLFEAIRSINQRVDVMDVGDAVCRALEFLHSKNVVYGALCSINVLLKYAPDGSQFSPAQIMLTRVGNRWWHLGWHAVCASREMRDPRQSVPLTIRQVVEQYGSYGPINWMSPEILQGRQCPDVPSDIYSFGLLLWEILAKRIPFDEFSVAQLIGYVGFGGGASRLFPSVADAFRVLPADVRVKAAECLSGQPLARPSTAQLQRLFRREPEPTVFSIIPKSMAKMFLGMKFEKERQYVQEDAVFVGKWVSVDQDLMTQYPDDVEKWKKFMMFRR